jgi:hypothetical protein
MSRYPTSAELAALRRSIAPIDGTPVDGGAFAHERQHGIGARGYLAGASAAFDRREASAMRSRAYGDWYTHRPASTLELTRGVPCGAFASYDRWAEDDDTRTPLPVAYGRSFTILSDAR